jgi:hypothetical protein
MREMYIGMLEELREVVIFALGSNVAHKRFQRDGGEVLRAFFQGIGHALN